MSGRTSARKGLHLGLTHSILVSAAMQGQICFVFLRYRPKSLPGKQVLDLRGNQGCTLLVPIAML